ncbi:hypothetical protein NPIL_102641 [Nephila pilipes]|uniref:Uncharacterized protein n=1 Tax=Nephila pilipes TaxID=299642 RepID=A0A8X6NBI0_NEPPI|nr:hypothetical protein NPIL_102641 [Nephila pilipes]
MEIRTMTSEERSDQRRPWNEGDLYQDGEVSSAKVCYPKATCIVIFKPQSHEEVDAFNSPPHSPYPHHAIEETSSPTYFKFINLSSRCIFSVFEEDRVIGN